MQFKLNASSSKLCEIQLRRSNFPRIFLPKLFPFSQTKELNSFLFQIRISSIKIWNSFVRYHSLCLAPMAICYYKHAVEYWGNKYRRF